jgi:O-methyltransferase involved in polyketide biosynthesis
LDIGLEPVANPGDAQLSQAAIAPGLSGVSETMLWSLHNRACEARRHDGILDDPRAISIHNAIHYDFHHHFGTPGGSLAARAAQIDQTLRQWLMKHPDGLVVSLGEGLETQASRVDNGRMRWLSVDLPHAISLREQFISPTGRFAHLAASALLPSWMDHVDAASGLCVVAQGLLMYFEPSLVEQLFCFISAKFPSATMIFDTVPAWFSRLTMNGLKQTPHYLLPPMPWGIDHDQIESTLKNWYPGVAGIESVSYRAPRGLHRYMGEMVRTIPVLRHKVPCLVKVEF